MDLHGYGPARGEYPPHTHLEYGTAGVPRPECTPKHCGYAPPTTHHQYGITHPTYQPAAKPQVPTYQVEERQYPAGQYQPHIAYTRPYPAGGGTQTPCVSASCSECRDFRAPPTTCYTTTNECQPRTDLGPPPDIHPEVRPADLRPTPDVHRDVPPELRQDPRPECYDSRSLRSHHASHCDLREFQEWREMRGSRESVGTLPPELESHLKECRCPCDHLGYGNYQVSATWG